ncbi:hypothetical protein [Sutcliffiella rhizosphaerae]|uniref:Uncharacterized protein n=1 Tax=Sutcliffiella rhizosphaerae TaxID=2880967 RepID=A0ABM8YLT9_9BACI|nr:hypothetical protein [Sutcliffiella rhizosphaerae]CAG9620847.1 hypothetical protein BACCIP111883_01618 [Sutcliffiella rhizosphaerae]
MKRVEIPFSSNSGEQQAMAASGGCISFKPNGKVVFQFPSQEHYESYKSLIKGDK